MKIKSPYYYGAATKLKPVMADSSSSRKAMQIRSFHCSQLEEMVPPQSTIRLDQIKKLPTAFVLSCHHQGKKAEENIQDFSSPFWKEEKMAHPSFLSGSPPLPSSFYSTFMYRAHLCVPPSLLCALSICSSSSFFKESYKKLFWYLILWAIIHGVWKPFKKSPFLVFLNPDTLFGSKLKSFIEFKKAQPKICQKGVTWHKCYLCWWELCQDFKCSSWSKPSSYSFSFFSDFSFSSQCKIHNFCTICKRGPKFKEQTDAGLHQFTFQRL